MTIALGLQLSHALIQAPMAGVQGVELAAAVTAAGGLGSLPAAMLSTDQLDAALTAFRAKVDGPVNVNFFCHQPPATDERFAPAWISQLQPYFDEFSIDAASIGAGVERRPFSAEACEVLERHNPAVVSFHFGLPSPALVDRVHAMGSVIAATATTIDEALWLEAHGADWVIAQGIEAGGHRGNFLSHDMAQQLDLSALLEGIVAAVDLPVIAAGGIADAADVRRLLAAGASAVQVGTAFLLCDEATTSDVHRQALSAEGDKATAITNIFSGRPARGIVNRAIRELGPISRIAPAFPQAATAITALRQQAEAQGSGDFSPLWCGTNTRGCDSISAAAMIAKLMDSAH